MWVTWRPFPELILDGDSLRRELEGESRMVASLSFAQELVIGREAGVDFIRGGFLRPSRDPRFESFVRVNCYMFVCFCRQFYIVVEDSIYGQ